METVTEVPYALLNGVGVVAVVLLNGWLIWTGSLHTNREWQRMLTDHEREIGDIAHDRDEWRTAHRISEQARLEERENTRDLIQGFGSTLTGFLEGFRRAAEEAAQHKHDGGPT